MVSLGICVHYSFVIYSTCFHEDLEINIFGRSQALDEYNYTKNLSQTQMIQDLDFIGFRLFSVVPEKLPSQ